MIGFDFFCENNN